MKIFMKEAISSQSNRVDFVMGNVREIKPGRRITFHIGGNYLNGFFSSKEGNEWEIKGEDGKTYSYIPSQHLPINKRNDNSLYRADFIVQNVKNIKPGDRITFHVWGEYLKGVLKTKAGNRWQIEGEDGKNYYYIPV